MAIRPETFEYVRDLVRREAAIVLEAGKEYLVDLRLAPVAERLGLGSLEALVDRARREGAAGPLAAAIVDALTTNETLFFRDFHPFEALRTTVLPALVKERAHVRKLQIWSAASSTGQEAYSLAMLILEHFPELAKWQVKILGTDLSDTALTQARGGSYTQLEVNRGLPAAYLAKYFENLEGRWMVRPAVRSLVEFRKLNLIQPWPLLGPFDLIFLRNVLIYFDTATKQQILKRARGCLLPHGLLFLGTAETTMYLDQDWAPQSLGRASAFRAVAAAPGAPKAA